jgi:hypothetical protein
MTKLKSFGCSFIYGSELSGTDPNSIVDPSALTWPALIAKKLDLKYYCYARPGQGNLKIYSDILANSYQHDDSIYLINWTWIDRFDYVNRREKWDTIRPSESGNLEKLYYQHFHSQITDMILSASLIVSAAEHLNSLKCPFIMTYMDYNLFTTIEPTWHNPRYVEILQQKLNKILVNFDGLNFLDWSKKYNYTISHNSHPMEQAHLAAADYWLYKIQTLL